MRATACFSMYSDISSRTIARSSSNRNSASARAVSVLPTPVGPRKINEPTGRFGSCKSGTCTADGVRDRFECFVLADHALAQIVFHRDELLHLAFEHFRNRNAGPFRDDLGDVFFVDFFFKINAVLLQLCEPRPVRLRAVFRAPEFVRTAARRLCSDRRPGAPVRVRVLASSSCSLAVRIFSISSFSDCHLAFIAEDFSLQIGDAFFDVVEPFFRFFVRFARQSLPLDLELQNLAFEHIDLLRQRIDLDANSRRGFVDQVDRFVRQKRSVM